MDLSASVTMCFTRPVIYVRVPYGSVPVPNETVPYLPFSASQETHSYRFLVTLFNKSISPLEVSRFANPDPHESALFLEAENLHFEDLHLK
jgi:hypothetical protein